MLPTPSSSIVRTVLFLFIVNEIVNKAFVVLGFGSFVVIGSHPSTSSASSLRTEKSQTTLALVPAELLSDVVTSGTINMVSDFVAQFLETTNSSDHQGFDDDIIVYDDASRSDYGTSSFLLRYNYNAPRTQRLALFGLADGAVSHTWFLGLDSVVGEGQDLFDTVLKTAADTLVYTPLWCAWFLAFMTIFEEEEMKNGDAFDDLSPAPMSVRIRSIPSVWRSDWLELLRGNLGFFLPITGLIYGLVPREERVLAFGVAGLIYTTILSLWNQSRNNQRNNIY